jgi:hypothetical protein
MPRKRPKKLPLKKLCRFIIIYLTMLHLPTFVNRTGSLLFALKVPGTVLIWGSGLGYNTSMEIKWSMGKAGAFLRFCVAALAYVGAALLALVAGSFSGTGLVPVLVVAIGLCLGVAVLVLASPSAGNKPQDLGREDWKEVSLSELDRIRTRLKKLRETRIPARYNANVNAGLLVMLIVVAIALALFVGNLVSPAPAIAIALALALIPAPLLCSANIEKWQPGELNTALKRYADILGFTLPETVKLAPLVRYDRDKNGKPLPESLRVQYKPSAAGSGLLSIQFQCSMNRGPNGQVPYLYAVALCEKGSAAARSLSQLHYPTILTEASTSDGYDTVVFRQDTKCRSDGYHTKSDDVRKLAGYMCEAIAGL